MRARYLVLVLALLGADPKPSGSTITGSVVAVKDGKPVARDDVYVYLEEVGKRTKDPGAGKTAKIVQKSNGNGSSVFDPKVLVVPVGATVSFPNLQRGESHNVFSPTDPYFDLGKYPYDTKGRSHKFETDEEFDIFCDVHPDMWAKVKAVESAYIARVAGGKFSFANIPAGKYKVVAWVRNSPEVKSSIVTVDGSGTLTLDRELHLQVKSRSGCHDRKDGSQYPKTYTKPCPDDY